MPFRFRRSFGGLIRLNISKTGVSVSAGVPGAHVNYDLSNRRRKPVRVTVGVPGSGLSYYKDMGSEDLGINYSNRVQTTQTPGPPRSTLGVIFGWLLLIAVVAFIVVVAFGALINA
jgi:hypothetical protein